MSSHDLIMMGLRNLWRRKARTFLTVLGVIIGTASIVIMISIGVGLQESTQKNLEQMGSITTIEVNAAGGYYPEGESPPEKTIPLDDDAVKLMEDLAHVEAVMPVFEIYGLISTGRYEANISINGVTPENMKAFDIKVAEGEGLTGDRKNQIVFGPEAVNRFRDPRSRQWKEVEVDVMEARLALFVEDEAWSQNRGRGTALAAAGILERTDNYSDYSVYMNLEDLTKIQENYKRKNRNNGNQNNNRRRNNSEDKYRSVKVKVDDIANVQDVQASIKALGLQVWSLSDILVELQEQSKGIRLVLAAIGGVSLFVAALGITNTMIMSIYERTREIGVMKVLGAELRDIKRLFLFEAGLIGLLGGLAGLALSYGVSHLMNTAGLQLMGGFMGGAPDSAMSVIPLWLSGLALVFSCMVGVLSGYYPARRAMRLSALEAIRNE